MRDIFTLAAIILPIVLAIVWGSFLTVYSIKSNKGHILDYNFVCTKTELVGSAPNRKEECTQYTRTIEVTNDSQ